MSFRTASLATLLFTALSIASTDARAEDLQAPSNSTAAPIAANVGPLAPRLSLDEDAAPATVEPHPYSVGMRTTGQVLTIVGGAHLVAGVIATVVFKGQEVENQPTNGFGILLVGVPLLSTGVILTAVGIPLWAVGAHEVEPERASAYVPQLHVGLGQVMVTGAF